MVTLYHLWRHYREWQTIRHWFISFTPVIASCVRLTCVWFIVTFTLFPSSYSHDTHV